MSVKDTLNAALASVQGFYDSNTIFHYAVKGAGYGAGAGLGAGVVTSAMSYVDYAVVNKVTAPINHLVSKIPLIGAITAFTDHLGASLHHIGTAAYDTAHLDHVHVNPAEGQLGHIADHENAGAAAFLIATNNAKHIAGNLAKTVAITNADTLSEIYGVKAQIKHVIADTFVGFAIGAAYGAAYGVYVEYFAPKELSIGHDAGGDVIGVEDL